MSDQDQNATAPRRVVVAEDESLIRMDIVEILRDNGFDVVGEAGDGETAVALATELRPDLVVMDIRMPKLDGIEAAKRLSENHIGPVVLLTAFLSVILVRVLRNDFTRYAGGELEGVASEPATSLSTSFAFFARSSCCSLRLWLTRGWRRCLLFECSTPKICQLRR